MAFSLCVPKYHIINRKKKGDMDMEEDKITIYDMVVQLIKNGQFSSEQEDELGILLTNKQKRREEERLGRCFLGILCQEINARENNGEFKPETAKRYQQMIQRYFDGIYGNMDAANISQEMLYKFITETNETLGEKRGEMFIFMNLLNEALCKMEKDGLLGFTPSKNLFFNFKNTISDVKSINSSYSYAERKAIGQWILCHLSDIRGLACGLWILGESGLSPDKIMGLTKQDAWKYCTDGLDKQFLSSGILDFDKALNQARARENIIQMALKLHPEEESYVFMVQKGENDKWKKLSGPALQVKMSWICRNLQIPYKPFRNDEAIAMEI